MTDNSYVKESFTSYNFGYDFYSGKQIFKNAWTQNIIEDEVAKMRHNNLITDVDLKIVNFIYKQTFATANIIADFLGNSTEESKAILDKLVKSRMLNKFIISAYERTDYPTDALEIYCLDYGGKKLLMHYGEPGDDSEKWTQAWALMSVPRISAKLLSADFYVQLMKNCGSNLSYLKANPIYRKHRDPVTPDFEFAIKYGDGHKYFIGVVARENNLQPEFREMMAKVDDMVSSKIWMKYFYDDQSSPPIVIVIAENDRVALEAAKIVATRTSISAVRYTTDERMHQQLSEKGAFMKFIPADADAENPAPHLVLVKSSVFSK
jgi:hypothetical protein